MILSFHPCFEADKNILCAGREPDVNDLAAIRLADAVILPQGCKKPLYEMANKNCSHVFPNYKARFSYPGKTGQIKLFQEQDALHPNTITYDRINLIKNTKAPPLDFPFVFKFDWGGEGSTVFLIQSDKDFKNILQKAEKYERTGYKGFLIQEYIPSQNKSLRATIVGGKFFSYWCVQKDVDIFGSHISQNAVIDKDGDPELQKKAVGLLKPFCEKTGINLAGFDFLFSAKNPEKPIFLEINYFFGRRGFGNSEKYYKILNDEISAWINQGFTH